LHDELGDGPLARQLILVNWVGSPVWTRFELSLANSGCDRTPKGVILSSLPTLSFDACPLPAPSLGSSRTRQVGRAISRRRRSVKYVILDIGDRWRT
jgi:hypothetical protein